MAGVLLVNMDLVRDMYNVLHWVGGVGHGHRELISKGGGGGTCKNTTFIFGHKL
jgi:hypothetical protein